MKLTVENVSARRGEDLLFRNIAFELQSGEALLLTGKNGSGKSTLIRVLAGLIRPETGSVVFTGVDGSTEHPLREASHYLGHRNAMKQELTVEENLLFWQSFMGDFDGNMRVDIRAAAEVVGLAGILHLPYGYLSAGQQRRFAMAKLLTAYRPVWLLDEPTAALDASADRMFARLVETHLAIGGIVIAATHQPLGLKDTKELKMKGFEYLEEEV
ncbi:heme ABC exporter ATP-binding protein CcmA [Rhizobium sp. PAMB 3182]